MLRVTTPAAATPAMWTEALITSSIRPRLSGAVAADDGRLLEITEELTKEGEGLATGDPGALWYQGYTERIVIVNPTKRLYLQGRPVAAVTSVQFDTEDALSEGTDPEDYTIYPGFLYREDGWDRGEPGWSVVYLGGYWLSSMGASPPATISSFVDADGHDRRAYHLRRALWAGLQATWSTTNRDPSVRRHSKDGRSIEYRDDAAAVAAAFPPAATATFLREGASRRAA